MSGLRKLHIGCGSVILPEFENLDILLAEGVDISDDASRLTKVRDNCYDLIYASHVLEHFSRHETLNILMLWMSKLKKGGIIRLAVPDFDSVVEWMGAGGKIEDVTGLICGGQKDSFDYHKMIFNENNLSDLLIKAGFY